MSKVLSVREGGVISPVTVEESAGGSPFTGLFQQEVKRNIPITSGNGVVLATFDLLDSELPIGAELVVEMDFKASASINTGTSLYIGLRWDNWNGDLSLVFQGHAVEEGLPAYTLYQHVKYTVRHYIDGIHEIGGFCEYQQHSYLPEISNTIGNINAMFSGTKTFELYANCNVEGISFDVFNIKAVLVAPIGIPA